MYKLTSDSEIVLRLTDGAWVHFQNPTYLIWLAEGNTPEPADIPDPKIAIRAQITSLEQAQLMPRATREFMLLFVEQNNLTAMPGYAPLKAFDDEIVALRNQL